MIGLTMVQRGDQVTKLIIVVVKMPHEYKSLTSWSYVPLVTYNKLVLFFLQPGCFY